MDHTELQTFEMVVTYVWTLHQIVYGRAVEHSGNGSLVISNLRKTHEKACKD